MSGQIAGSPAAILVMSRNPPGRELQQDRVLFGDLTGLVHQRAGQEVRHVAGDGHQAVVVVGADRHDVGADLAQDAVQRAVGARRGVDRSASGPRCDPRKRSARAPASPRNSDPAMGCPPRNRSSIDRADDRALHAGDVGHDRRRGSSSCARTSGRPSATTPGGRGDDDQVDVGSRSRCR